MNFISFKFYYFNFFIIFDNVSPIWYFSTAILLNLDLNVRAREQPSQAEWMERVRKMCVCVCVRLKVSVPLFYYKSNRKQWASCLWRYSSNEPSHLAAPPPEPERTQSAKGRLQRQEDTETTVTGQVWNRTVLYQIFFCIIILYISKVL